MIYLLLAFLVPTSDLSHRDYHTRQAAQVRLGSPDWLTCLGVLAATPTNPEQEWRLDRLKEAWRVRAYKIGFMFLTSEALGYELSRDLTYWYISDHSRRGYFNNRVTDRIGLQYTSVWDDDGIAGWEADLDWMTDKHSLWMSYQYLRKAYP